jgi:hypothetical protein
MKTNHQPASISLAIFSAITSRHHSSAIILEKERRIF